MQIGRGHVYRKEAGEGEDGGGTDVVEQVEGKDPPELETKARNMGWTPKDEFRGDPDKWRGAKEFVDRGENMLPIVRATVKRQENQIAELRQTIGELADHNTKTEQKAFTRALRELKAQQIEAVSSGNAAAFAQVDQAIYELHKEAAEAPKVKLPDPGVDPEYQEWEEKNRWVVTDKDAGAYAESYGEYLRKTGSTLTGAAFLEKVGEAVKKQFPDKFSNPRRNSPGAVEGNTPPAKKGGTGYADLPAEAKAACDRFVKNSGGKMTRESYSKQYFSEE